MIHLNLGSNLVSPHGSRFNNIIITINLLIEAKIEIKKIGYVEPTSNKTILLYPGSYEFVAKCRNHKDNLKKVQIPIDDKKIVVRIGCGEQI